MRVKFELLFPSQRKNEADIVLATMFGFDAGNAV